MIDLAVVGGTVVDGTGAPARRADVGVVGDRVVAVAEPGSLPDADRTIDATDRIVTPGFVDPHTHLDVQLFWEPSGSPSVLHGVTSVVISSCGFGVAPLAPGQDEYVLRSLESVEEIPYDVTRRAVPMSWGSWVEYFEVLGDLPLGVNVGAFVPHSALRTGELGERGTAPDLSRAERQRLVAALDEALAAGAVGMSTSRGSNHTDATGAPVPSRLAGDDELVALVARCAGRAWQINIAAKGDASDEGIRRALDELARYDAWSQAADTRVTWTPLVVGPGDDVAWRRLLAFAEDHQDRSVPQVSAQPIFSTIGFDGPSFAALIDGWAEAFTGYGDLTPDQVRERLASAAFRDRLKAAPENPARVTAPAYDRWTIGVSPSAPEAVGQTVRAYADARGRHPVDALVDLALADGLGTVVEAPLSNLDDDARRQLVTADSTLLGLGDAGAHVKSISNYSYPTSVLADMVRDRGWLGLERAVAELTSRPAELLHLEGRGTLREGGFADVCVIDLARLAQGPAELVPDLPGGAPRLHRAATGYDAVVVNGAVVVDHDEAVPNRAGRLLRVRS